MSEPLVLCSIRVGAHLYGTVTENSDEDVKQVLLPNARNLLLQRASDITSTTNKDDLTKKSGKGILEVEKIPLHRFLDLVTQGQPMAIDMLFAPEWAHMNDPHPIWDKIVSNRLNLLTKQTMTFVHYCRTQAKRYSLRGDRLASARAARDLLQAAMDKHGTTARLYLVTDQIQQMVSEQPHQSLVPMISPHGKEILFWEICERRAPLTGSIKTALIMVDAIVKEYGKRAAAAEINGGTDWKAISHAIRISSQAVELLTTGAVTFPPPNHKHLLDVKLGLVDREETNQEIDALLLEVESAAERSVLPDTLDQEWIDDLVVGIYYGRITGKY